MNISHVLVLIDREKKSCFFITFFAFGERDLYNYEAVLVCMHRSKKEGFPLIIYLNDYFS